MNKYEEALKAVLDGKYGEDDTCYKVDGLIYKKDYNTLQELVDRATPMKPDSYHNCPKCYAPITRGQFAKLNDNFCPHCGQALEWEGK